MKTVNFAQLNLGEVSPLGPHEEAAVECNEQGLEGLRCTERASSFTGLTQPRQAEGISPSPFPWRPEQFDLGTRCT